MDKPINERLNALRNKLNLSQSEFAKSLDLTQGAYSAIERGKANVSGDTKINLINKYHVNMLWLEQGIGEMFAMDNPENEKIYPSSSDIKESCTEQLVELSRLRTEVEFHIKLQEVKDKLIDSLERELNSLREKNVKSK